MAVSWKICCTFADEIKGKRVTGGIPDIAIVFNSLASEASDNFFNFFNSLFLFLPYKISENSIIMQP